MEKKNEALGVSFTLPDRVTVRMQLNYSSLAVTAYGQELFERFWNAARTVVQDWKCELVPDIDKLDLDAVDDPKIAEIVRWTGWEVKQYMDALENIPKN